MATLDLMRRYVPLLLPLLLLLASCQSRPNDPGTVIDPDPHPVLDDFSPREGFPGSTITITGAGLGNNPAKVAVLFDGRDTARILSVAPNRIVAAVPFPPGAKTVEIHVAGSKVWTFPARFTVRGVEDPAYDTAGIALAGTMLGYASVSSNGVGDSWEGELQLATTLVAEPAPARFSGGRLVLSSHIATNLGSGPQTIELTQDTASGRFARVSFVRAIDSTIVSSARDSEITALRMRLVMRNVPYTLDGRGGIAIRLPVEACAPLIDTLVEWRRVVKIRGGVPIDTLISSTGSLRGLLPGSTWSITVAPRQ